MRAALLALAFCLVAGCGPVGSNTSTNTSTSSFHCCVNKAWYTCPTSDAVNKCINDTSSCTRDSSKDSQCL